MARPINSQASRVPALLLANHAQEVQPAGMIRLLPRGSLGTPLRPPRDGLADGGEARRQRILARHTHPSSLTCYCQRPIGQRKTRPRALTLIQQPQAVQRLPLRRSQVPADFQALAVLSRRPPCRSRRPRRPRRPEEIRCLGRKRRKYRLPSSACGRGAGGEGRLGRCYVEAAGRREPSRIDAPFRPSLGRDRTSRHHDRHVLPAPLHAAHISYNVSVRDKHC